MYYSINSKQIYYKIKNVLTSSFFAFTSSTVFSLISGVVFFAVSVLSTSTSCLQQNTNYISCVSILILFSQLPEPPPSLCLSTVTVSVTPQSPRFHCRPKDFQIPRIPNPGQLTLFCFLHPFCISREGCIRFYFWGKSAALRFCSGKINAQACLRLRGPRQWNRSSDVTNEFTPLKVLWREHKEVFITRILFTANQ